MDIGRAVGVNGEVVAPSEVQEYLGAVGLNSMDVVRAMGRRRRRRIDEADVSEEAIFDVQSSSAAVIEECSELSLSLFCSAQII